LTGWQVAAVQYIHRVSDSESVRAHHGANTQTAPPGGSTGSWAGSTIALLLMDWQVAAVQYIHRVSDSESVRVHHCASHGYDYVAPRSAFTLRRGSIDNNHGYAVGALVLNGESSDQLESQFVPLRVNTAPFNVYGLLRMCTVQVLLMRDRVQKNLDRTSRRRMH